MVSFLTLSKFCSVDCCERLVVLDYHYAELGSLFCYSGTTSEFRAFSVSQHDVLWFRRQTLY